MHMHATTGDSMRQNLPYANGALWGSVGGKPV